MPEIERIGIFLLLTIFAIELVVAITVQASKRIIQDMLANLAIGLSTLATGLFMKGVSFVFFSWVYTYTFFAPELSAGLWIAGFLSCDFVIYLYHLLGHKTRLFWAAHVTHHSSLEYNISVGFRVSCIHVLYRFLFWSPLCLFGIPPWMILFFDSLTTLHNVLIHTERIRKLGALDLIFNTPSNHRVHHASNPQYLDKNMGGILIIYDRLFGTYAPEREKPVYGITHNIYTHNPVTILLHEYRYMFHQLLRIRGWKRKIRFLFSPPGDIITHKNPSVPADGILPVTGSEAV
ncbi:MAG: sterol desaturase family protein [Chitinophagaceae bacterium]|nr:sterol desaturase family protein [Chitinophagaceae bacterium]